MFESKALMPWRPTSKKTAIEDIDDYDEKLNKSKRKKPEDDEDQDSAKKVVEFWDRKKDDVLMLPFKRK
jgi:hypothetical protein